MISRVLIMEALDARLANDPETSGIYLARAVFFSDKKEIVEFSRELHAIASFLENFARGNEKMSTRSNN